MFSKHSLQVYLWKVSFHGVWPKCYFQLTRRMYGSQFQWTPQGFLFSANFNIAVIKLNSKVGRARTALTTHKWSSRYCRGKKYSPQTSPILATCPAYFDLVDLIPYISTTFKIKFDTVHSSCSHKLELCWPQLEKRCKCCIQTDKCQHIICHLITDHNYHNKYLTIPLCDSGWTINYLHD